MVQEDQVALKLNGTHYLMIYGYDLILFGDYINTIKNTETSIDAMEVGGLKVKR
jgi:hypothetical protein